MMPTIPDAAIGAAAVGAAAAEAAAVHATPLRAARASCARRRGAAGMARAWGCLLLLGCLLVPRGAHAQQQDDEDTTKLASRRHYVRGVGLLDADPGAAAAEFERAYELYPVSAILFNLALAYRRLERPVRAAETLERLLQDPSTLKPERIQAARDLLKQELARVGELEVSTAPGAVVRINDVDRGVAPGPFRVRAGVAHVEVTLAGFSASKLDVTVAAGDRRRQEVTLQPSSVPQGRLAVRVNVIDATILIDGDIAFGVSPVDGRALLPTGDHTVRVTREGYLPATRQIRVLSGDNDVAVELALDDDALSQSGGRLALDISEEQAMVVVDGVARGVYQGAYVLPPGRHELRVERGGFYPSLRTVTVRPAEVTTVAIELSPTPEEVIRYSEKADAVENWAWGMLVTGLVITTGSSIGLIANRYRRGDIAEQRRSFDQRCVEDSSLTLEAKNACIAEGSELDQTTSLLDGLDVATSVGIAVGVGGGIASAILFATGNDPDKYRLDDSVFEARLMPLVSPLPGGAFVGVGGTF